MPKPTDSRRHHTIINLSTINTKMMTSDKPEFCRLERPIEIYENERLWIGRGFSKAGLLPTERGAYSTQDGSLSWKSMREASLALLRGHVENCINGKNAAAVDGRRKVNRRGWSFHEDINGNDHHQSTTSEHEDNYECSIAQGNNGSNKSLHSRRGGTDDNHALAKKRRPPV